MKLKLKKTNKSITEKVLRPRLKILGYILCTLGLCSLIYAFLTPSISYDLPPTTQLSEFEDFIEQQELIPYELLNFFLVSFVFFFLSFICFFTAHKRKKNR